jgi:hypothetical protein
MASHDIAGTAAREADPGSGRKRAAIAALADATDELESAAEVQGKKKKAASAPKARRAKQDKPEPEPQDDDAEEGEADGSHPRPDHATILRLLWHEFAVSPEVAAAALNVSRNSGYAAIHKGDIPATRVGNRLMVPTAYLRQRLYLEPPSPGTEPTPQRAAHPKKQETVKSTTQRRRRR